MSDDLLDLDFTGVSREGGGEFKLVPEGEQQLIISDIAVKPSKTSEYRVVHVKYEVGDASCMDFFSLHPDAIWNFRNWLEAVTGQEFDGPISFNPKELISKPVGGHVTIEDHYDKKKAEKGFKQNKIESYFNIPF